MNERNDSLIQRAAALPESIEPERDLWPHIAAKIMPVAAGPSVQIRRVWPIALAASLTLAVLSSSVTWWLMQQPDISSARIVELMTNPAVPLVQDAELIRVRQELTSSLNQSLMRLSPSTRQQVSTNLLEIHESLADIRTALDQDPNNAFLHQLLYSTYQQQLGLLSDINKAASLLPNEIEI